MTVRQRLAASLFLLAIAACRRSAPPPAVEPARMTTHALSPVHRLLDSAIAAGAAPGAVLGVSVDGVRSYYGVGRLGLGDYTEPDSATIYDLASLTKVIGLTTIVMLAVDEGRLALDSAVQRYVPAFQGPGKELVTVRHLLTHSSGMPAWRSLFTETTSRAEALALADTTPLDTLPGVRAVYSDLGIMVLTQAVEAVYGARLDAVLERRVTGPLQLQSVRYLPPADWVRRIAPTENDPWRGRILRGEVHDENASRLDGVSGHAGLFGNAVDLLAFGEWLTSSHGSSSHGSAPSGADRWRIAPPASLEEFVRRQEIVAGSSRALGWDTPSEGSSAGTRLSPGSFGHTGFTGTSIWIDPARDLVIVLLSNRVHPTRENTAWGPIRARVADLVVATLFPDAR